MQILAIHLKNIKSHRDTELSFSAGINVLAGPNGAGKSTVFEAIGYALFGVDARDFVSNVDRFLSIGAKKGEISVTFASGGETWRVIRTVGAPAKWLLARETDGSFEVEEHARIEETEARIAELLGLSGGRPLAEQFKLVIGPFQNEFLGPFVIRQPTKRQEAFDEILGIDAWRKTYKGTSSLIAVVQKKIEVLAAEVKVKDEQVAVLPEKEAELTATNTSRQAKQAEIEVRRGELQRAVENLLKLERQKTEIDRTKSESQQIDANIAAGKEHLANQEALVAQAGEAVRIVAESRAGKERFDAAEALLKVLRERDRERQQLQLAIGDMEKKREGLLKAMELEKRELEQLAAELRGGEKELAAGDEALQRAVSEATQQEKGRREALAQLAAIRSAFLELPIHRVYGAWPYLSGALERLAVIEAELAVKKSQLQGADETAALAARLPELRAGLARAQDERARLLGVRQNLIEGRDKLAEGVCPFFREPCLNIAGKSPTDMFKTKVEELDEEVFRLDKTIVQMETAVCAAEKADRDAMAFQGIREEILRLEEEHGLKAAESEKRLLDIAPRHVAKSFAEWRESSGLDVKGGEALPLPDVDVAGAPAEQLRGLAAWSEACRALITNAEEALDRRKEEGEELHRATEKDLAGLAVRQDELKKRRTELADKRSGLAGREKRIGGLDLELKETAGALQSRLEELKGFAGLEKEIAAAEREHSATQGERDRFVAHSAIAAELPVRRQRLDQFRERLALREREKGEKLANLTELEKSFRMEEYESARQEQDRLRVAVATMEQELKGLEENRRRLEGEIGQLRRVKKEIAEKLAEVKNYEEKEKLVKFLRNQVFKNVSAQLSERFREEISLRADRIYRTIAEADEELVWGEQYRIVLRDMTDGVVRERSDDQLSGGQTMSAVVALRLALLQTIGARLAFFDEPTSNLDAARRENLAHAFRAIDVGREEVTEHWYDQLFLISHDVAFTEITDQMIRLGDE